MSNTSVLQSLPHGFVLQGKRNAYIIECPLGQGAFGITYLAKYRSVVQGEMGRGSAWIQVCVKEFFMRELSSREESTGSLHEATGNSLVSRYRRAFLREANNLARMQHPNIVNVFEVIEANNTAYIVMEYIDGGNLDDYIARKGRLSEDEALRLFQPICDAMSYMHAQRMLHLDLKPKNVMLDEEGKPYLIDFGLSKQYTPDGEPESSTSIGLGTPGYAPSEQAEQRDGDTSFRATIDVYALGGTLYKMLTGETPPKASEILNDDELLSSKLHEAGVSDKLIEVVEKAMKPASRKRYQSVAELMVAMGWEVNNAVNIGSNSQGEGQEVQIQFDEETVFKHDIKPPLFPEQNPTPTPTKRKSKRIWIIGSIAIVAFSSFAGIKTTHRQKGRKCYLIAKDYLEKKDTIPAVDYLKKAVKNGNPAAMTELGLCYLNGNGVETDTTKAVNFFRRAASKGEARAQSNFGFLYWHGKGVEKDLLEAVKWYRKAAEQGSANAQCSLGWMYCNGEGVKKDYSEAVKWYRKAAEQGSANAQCSLGVMYCNGEGVKKDYSEAEKWYRKAAEQGDANAQYNLGLMYDEGFGVKRDFTEAEKWYRKAAEQGDANAQLNIGAMYYEGEGVEKDYSEAIKWCRKAAEQGHAGAQYNLGLMHYNGLGVKRDFTEAEKWFRNAAEQGHANAQYNLGLMHYNGFGVKRDFTEAVKWYRKAAEQGVASAQYNLGLMYDEGEGVEQDYSESKKWFQKAAEQGHAGAQYNLGVMYYNGEGVERDYSEAVKWFRKAAGQGNANAQNSLGVCYQYGRGVSIDPAQARSWYEKAAAQGNEKARKKLSEL